MLKILNIKYYSTASIYSDAQNKMDFDDPMEAFRAKSTKEIARSIFVFRICTIQPFVKNANSLLNLSNRILGSTFTDAVVRHTFFNHFCGGETKQSIMPTVNRLKKAGVGSILDYAAEADIVDDNPAEAHEVTGAVFSEHIEERQCDENVNIFLECIEGASQFEDGFAAIKVTALGRPILLTKMTQIIDKTMTLFKEFDADETNRINRAEFERGLRKLGCELTPEQIDSVFSEFDDSGLEGSQDGYIDPIEWLEYLKVEDLSYRPLFTTGGSGGLPTLTDEELVMLEKMMGRLYKIADIANQKGVKLMVDAEHTYFQGAIDHAVLNLMRKYNRNEQIIFNTYQAYLKNTHDKMQYHMRKARREGFLFSCKLVRGAYMNLESKRAKDIGYPNPICDTIEDTHKNYDKCLDLLFENLDMSKFMLATHNQASIEYACEKMESISSAEKNQIYFGQLLGMADNLSFPLGAEGYNVYKYVPYGPLKEVIPYLVRRAEENSNMLGGTAKERKMLTKEFGRRILRLGNA